MSNSVEPSSLPGCSVLPPMEADRPYESSQQRTPTRAKLGDRFTVLNSFIDFTMRSLRRNEMAVWLILYRDTKSGTARTSIADIARRTRISTRTAQRAVAGLQL